MKWDGADGSEESAVGGGWRREAVRDVVGVGVGVLDIERARRAGEDGRWGEGMGKMEEAEGGRADGGADEERALGQAVEQSCGALLDGCAGERAPGEVRVAESLDNDIARGRAEIERPHGDGVALVCGSGEAEGEWIGRPDIGQVL